MVVVDSELQVDVHDIQVDVNDYDYESAAFIIISLCLSDKVVPTIGCSEGGRGWMLNCIIVISLYRYKQ